MSKLIKVKSSRKKITQAERYKKLWETIKSKEVRNEKYRIQMQKIVDQYGEKIHKEETILNENEYLLLEKLVSHLQKKSLTKWQREELENWIEKFMNDLIERNAIPIKKVQDIMSILEEYRDKSKQDEINLFDEETKQKLKTQEQEDNVEMVNQLIESILNESGIRLTDFLTEEELDSLYANPNKFALENTDKISQILMDAAAAMYAENSHKIEKEETLKDKKIFHESAIDKIYKKLAKVFHPDLTTDEEEKKKRHELMSELSEAKKNHDLLWIIEKYNQFVPNDKLDFSESDFDKFNEMLRRKSLKLDDKHEQYKNSAPFIAWADEYVYSKSDRVIEKRINEHILELKKEINDVSHLLNEVKTLKGLKPILEIRYDDNRNSFNPFEMMNEMGIDLETFFEEIS